MSKILIVEDDQNINNMIFRLLTLHNYEALQAFSGSEALLCNYKEIDLILLDLMIPGKDGKEVIKEIKKNYDLPIIIMSALSDRETKLDLFSLGAEDYITKPFDNEELLARIKVQLRTKKIIESEVKITYKDLTINLPNYEVTCANNKVETSKIEFNLLRLLMENPGLVHTKASLFEKVWKDSAYCSDDTLNVHISKLRKKLKDANPEEEYIETVWSIGYKMK